MSGFLRPARPDDLPGILRLKADLRLRADAESAGGFLLGTAPETYAAWIDSAAFWILETANGLSGFGIGLGDDALRSSDIWARRGDLASDPGLVAALESVKLGYFEQLAVARDPVARRFAALLAARVCEHLFDSGHQFIVTTTVSAPVTNRAAWPFLRRAGSTRIGTIDEHYAGIGPVRSDVHVVSHAGFLRARAGLDAVATRHRLVVGA